MSTWERTHTELTTAAPEAVWRRWTDIDAWADDDPGLAHAEIDAAGFVLGGTGRVKDHGSPSQRFVLTRLEPLRAMDLTITLPGARLEVTHLLEPDGPPGERWLRCTHGVRISSAVPGVAAAYGALVGASLARGLPEVVRLVTGHAVRDAHSV